MLNLVHILFLVFGWIYGIKGLVITALVISSLFFLVTLVSFSNSEGDDRKGNTNAMLAQIVVLCLSIVCLCIG